MDRHKLLLATSLVGLLGIIIAAPYEAQAQETPFIGQIAESNVDARAGAGRAYYVVSQFKQGDLVHVQEQIFGWYRIAAPEGCYSYVSKTFVDADDDGLTGTVNADRTDVKAGSINGPSESYRVQLMLKKDRMVQIVGEVDSFYKIIPPVEASVFVPPGSVQETTQPPPVGSNADGSVRQYRQEPINNASRDSEDPEFIWSETFELESSPPHLLVNAQVPTIEPAPLDSGLETVAITADTTDLTLKTFVDPLPDDEVPTPAEINTTTTAEPSAVVFLDSAQAPPRVQFIESVDVESQVATAAGEPAASEAIQATRTEDRIQFLKPSAAAPLVAQSEAPKAVQPASGTNESLTLDAIEQRFVLMSLLPLEQQDIDRISVDYRRLADGTQLLTSVEQQLVSERIAVLDRNAKILDAIHAATAVRDRIGMLSAANIPGSASDTEISYDAIGQLQVSSVYNGQTLPRMFRLVSTVDTATIAYLDPSDLVDRSHMLGQMVGIVGQQSYDPAVKVNIINIERIDVLDPVIQ